MKFALLVVTLSNAVEIYYISSLGTESLAVFTHLLPLLLIFDAIGIGLGAGASSLYARLFSSPGLQKRVAPVALLLSLAGTGLLALMLWLFREPLLTVLHLKPDHVQANAYLGYWLAGSVCLVTNMTAAALLRAANQSRLAAIGLATAAAVNIGLAPFLIHGLWAPALGLAGAGLAQAIGAGTCSVLLFSFVAKQNVKKLTRALRITLRPDQFLRVGYPILKVALPAALANSMVPLGALLVVQLLSVHGTPYVGAYGLALRLEALCLVIFYAYSSVAGPLFGERQVRHGPRQCGIDIKQCTTLCVRRGLVLALLLAPATLAFPLWPTACTDVIPALSHYFWWVPVSYGAYGLVMVANAAFNGVGVPLYGLAISFLRCIGLLLPLAWLMGETAGGDGIWMAISLANILAAILAYHLLLHAIHSAPKPVTGKLVL